MRNITPYHTRFCCCAGLLLLVWLWPAWSPAATYFVNGSVGDNGNSCTTARSDNCPAGGSCARQTLQGGSGCLNAGDTLIIRGGTYTNQCLGDTASPDVAALPAGISAGSPTTVRAATGETVLIRATQHCNPGPGSTATITMDDLSKRWIVIDGINITANGTIQLAWVGSRDFTLRNAVLSHGREGIIVYGQDSLIENVVLRYMGYNESFVDVCPVPELGCHGSYLQGRTKEISDPHTTGNIYRHVTSHGNTGIGITMSCEACPYMVHDNLVERSLVYDNHSYGILQYPGNTTQNTISYNNYSGFNSAGNLFNNTAIDNVNTNMLGARADQGIQVGGGQVRNNISLGHSECDICPEGGSPAFSQNICGASGTGCALTSTVGALFVNPGARDFHLLPTASVAINAGTSIAQVTNDYFGDARTDGAIDIGADELNSGDPTPVGSLPLVS